LPIADQNHGTLKGPRATLKAVKLYSLELDIAPLTGRIIKNRLPCFRKRRIFATKWLCYTLYFRSVNCQKSTFKVRIYVNKKPTFLKRASYFKS